MKNFSAIVFTLLLCWAACTKKTTNNSPTDRSASSGTMTESKGGASNSAPDNGSNAGAQANAPGAPRDLSGTWIVAQPGETWELVITRADASTWNGSSTLVQTDNPKGLDGPVGTKGDAIVIVSDGPGKFRVRWAKAEDYHDTNYWQGTGTYDDNSFDFAGYYKGRRKG